MANKERGEVKITLDGKEITLVPSYKNFAEIEDATGIFIFDLAQNLTLAKCSLRNLVKTVEILSGQNKLGEAVFKTGYSDVMVRVAEVLVIGMAGGPLGKPMAKVKI